MAQLAAGSLLECRVARLFNREGQYARRRVDVGRRFAPAKLTVTDVDVLALQFGSDLRATRTIVECKTGGTVKEMDRILWLAGLARLTSAQQGALFISGRTSVKARNVGRELDILVQDAADLDRREVALRIDREPEWGSHDPRLLANEDEVRRRARRVPEAERAYWFLRSECWYLPPSLAIKRAIAVVEILSRLHVAGLEPQEAAALEWLLADAVVVFSVAAVELAGVALALPREDFRRLMSERLAEGIASYSQLQRLSNEVDKYVLGILERAGVPRDRTIQALGALAPHPPPYADALTEVVERLSERPRAARHLPLALDFVLASRIRRDPPEGIGGLAVLPIESVPETLALARLCSAFLKGQAQLVPEVARVIDETSTNRRREEQGPLAGDVSGAPETAVDFDVSRVGVDQQGGRREDVSVPSRAEPDPALPNEVAGDSGIDYVAGPGGKETSLPIDWDAY